MFERGVCEEAYAGQKGQKIVHVLKILKVLYVSERMFTGESEKCKDVYLTMTKLEASANQGLSWYYGLQV